jgi:hypothetical protein
MSSMTTLSNTYPTGAGARRAAEAMRATGESPHDIRLLIGRRPGDVRREPVGGFAGPVAPATPVGTFGDRRVLRRQGAGSFAGDPARQRQGSFADTNRFVIVTYDVDVRETVASEARAQPERVARAA